MSWQPPKTPRKSNWNIIFNPNSNSYHYKLELYDFTPKQQFQTCSVDIYLVISIQKWYQHFWSIFYHKHYSGGSSWVSKQTNELGKMWLLKLPWASHLGSVRILITILYIELFIKHFHVMKFFLFFSFMSCTYGEFLEINKYFYSHLKGNMCI